MEFNDDRIRRKYEMLLEEIGYFRDLQLVDSEAFLDLDLWAVVPCGTSSFEKPEFYPEEGHRLVAIEHRPAFEAFNNMETFIDKVDEEFGLKLRRALRYNRPFSRFKTLVLNSEYRQLWHEHHNKCRREAAQQWMEENKVTVEGDRLVSPYAFEFHYLEYFEDELLDSELFEN